MTAKNLPPDDIFSLQKPDRYCAIALSSLSLAIFMLSVVVFTLYPLPILGSIAIVLGITCMCYSILNFIFYSRALREEEKSQAT